MSENHDHNAETNSTGGGEEKHSHGNLASLRALSRKRLMMVAAVTGSFMVAEIVAGLLTHSLAILADAGHMLGDVAALVLALIAAVFATKSATTEKTYGYYRAEILASTFNALCMLGMSVFILIEAYQRFFKHEDVPGMPMIVVGILGGLINLLSMKLLGSDSKDSLNTKAVYLEVLSDMLASVGVVIAGVVIKFTGLVVVDPIVSVLIALGLIPRTWHLLMQCVHVLMEGTPDHIALNKLRKAILSIEGVQGLHDLHVWTITSGLDAMSSHVRTGTLTLSN
ncbi:MAG: cation transporter [Candidatus Obscuribacter sp.]|nr:cation transporter [Candidatus Obscuribacter sp.]